MKEDKTTDFGYTQVPVKEKEHKVAEVFHSVSNNYDLMNDLMSFGIHRYWKDFTLQVSGIKAGDTVLDIAGGTGDLAQRCAKRVGKTGKIILADINSSMLEIGRNRLTNQGLIGNIEYIQANAECLPFADNTFDCISIAFGLRNVTTKQNALASMLRVLKPGGQLLVLEFSKPTLSPLKRIYDAYSFSLLPKLGKWVAKDEKSYQYLAESIRKHPDQQTLKTMMQQQGFTNCRYHNLTGGIVALHRGSKA